MSNSVWKIHGKSYDLTPFMKYHPGGDEILRQTKGIEDATPLFESYHSMASDTKYEYIIETLKKYDLNEEFTEPLYTFQDNGIYCILKKKVRDALNGNIKAPPYYWLKVIMLNVLYLISYSYGLFSTTWYQSILCAVVAGMVNMSMGFCIMHDASHYAIFKNNAWLNQFVSFIYSRTLFWTGGLWLTHHVIHHHGFTGDPKRDPDTRHFLPFIKKHSAQKKSLLSQVKYMFLIIFIFPSLLFGQSIIYHITWPLKGNVWRLKYSGTTMDKIGNLIFYIAHLGFLIYLNWIFTIAFILNTNIWYAINILPDHDMIQTYHNEDLDKKDWGEMQIINSGNFGGPLWCFFFGGINYQIEHHLFPQIHHSYYPKISDIIKAECEKNSIPYVHSSNVYEAMKSVFDKLKEVNANTKVKSLHFQ